MQTGNLQFRQILLPIFFVFAILVANTCFAQKDSLVASPQPAKDTITTARTFISDTIAHKKEFQPNPKKAGLYSAILPGSGQLYNRQYWKMPIIYAGFGVAAYFIKFNYDNYTKYHNAYLGRINNANPTDPFVNYTQDQLKILSDDYEHYLDLTILYTAIGYIGQVLDAVTYAYLRNFDISRNLSMKIRPVMNPQGPGIGLVINVKPTQPFSSTVSGFAR